jgi:hypothetical protein
LRNPDQFEDAKAELFAKRIEAARLGGSCCHSVATAASSPGSAAEGNDLGRADGVLLGAALGLEEILA